MIETNPFENPKAIRQSLEKLKLKAKSDCTVKELIDIYKAEIGTLPLYPMTLQKGVILFRARRNTGDVKDLFKSLKEIGIKPKEKVKEFGRANLPKQTVFYASSNEETVVQEINQWHINDQGRFQDFISKGGLNIDWRPHTCFLTISAWLVTEEINLALLFGNELNRPPAIQNAKIKREALAHQSDSYRESWNLVMDFFSEEFGKTIIKTQYDYVLSALYAHMVMNNVEYPNSSQKKIDGVKYASIANNYRGENYALSENSYLNKIKFAGANFCVAFNNSGGKLGENKSCIIGKDYTAVLNTDDSFGYIDASDDYAYLMRYENKFMFIPHLPGREIVVKATQRMNDIPGQ